MRTSRLFEFTMRTSAPFESAIAALRHFGSPTRYRHHGWQDAEADKGIACKDPRTCPDQNKWFVIVDALSLVVAFSKMQGSHTFIDRRLMLRKRYCRQSPTIPILTQVPLLMILETPCSRAE
jgi:hypothetical protein